MCNLSELSELIEEKGIEKGRAEGLTEGRTEGQILIMRQMLESGMSVEKIAEIVKISINEVKDLLKV